MDSVEIEQRPAVVERPEGVVPFVLRAGLPPAAVQPAACGCNGNGGGGGDAPLPPERPSFVYALGKIEPRFPNLGVEREFMQATGRGGTEGLADPAAAHKILNDPDNRYLARQLCWVLTIDTVETYILRVRDPVDLELLIGAVRPVPKKIDVDGVIGVRGPLAPPEFCAGLVAPIVIVDQIYSFDDEKLVREITPPKGMSAEKFAPIAREVFDRIQQIADNAGNTDEHRAVNYLAVRDRGIYVRAAEQFARNFSLTGIEVLPSRLSGTRKLVNVVFVYTERATGVVEKYRARVDVTEEFPFLDQPVGLFIDRFTI